MRFNHITLRVADIPRARDFYARLGFQIIVDERHYCRFMAPVDNSTLSIEKHDGPCGSADQIGLEFESAEALDQTVSRLEADGFRFTQKPMDQSWLWRDAILNDPDGHQLLFYFAGKNRLHPPWRVGND